MSLTGIKRHVRLLEEADLVNTEKVGRARECRLGPGHLEDAEGWIEAHRRRWERRLDRLEDTGGAEEARGTMPPLEDRGDGGDGRAHKQRGWEAQLSKLIFDISMSLDGFATASGVRPEEPMGDGGQRLHEWARGADEKRREVLAESGRTVGASIAGRRTYDLSIPWWGADGPGGPSRTPTFVVSLGEPDGVPDDGVYTFVGSPEEALEKAMAVAGGKDVDVFSPSIGRQLLRAGRIEEIRVHLVPVLFGSGTGLFEDLGDEHIVLEPTEVIETSAATHILYRVVG